MNRPAGSPLHVDAIVLGAGISGLVSASILLDQGLRHVVVVDEYDHVGGNHIDAHCGAYTFDVGSLIFQDDSPLLNHFPELLPRYVPIDPRWSKLTPQGTIARYPFSVRDDVLASGPVECLRILSSAVLGRVRYRHMRNAGEFARYWIGARLLHRSGLEHYMERFCGLPAERIDLEFAKKRMLWLAENASPASVLRMLRPAAPEAEAAEQSNQQLARPPEGFGHLYAPAVEHLTQRGATFALGAVASGLARCGGTFTLCLDGRSVIADRVVSTIPVDHVLDLCGLPRERALPTVILVSLYFSFAGRRGFADPILYNFSHGGTWKRLTVYSDFYGPADGREYFGVEVVAPDSGPSVDDAEREFRAHVAANGLFGGDLRLEGSHVLANAYPIYTEGAAERAERAIAALRSFGVESLGRQGGFEYQPTARVSTIVAEATLRTT